MAKKLLHKYTFDASTKTVVLDGLFGQERLLMISNLAMLSMSKQKQQHLF